MTTGNKGLVLGIIGVCFIIIYVVNIVYQTIYPKEIAVFNAVIVPEKIYRVGDVVFYTVDMYKLYYTPSTVVRQITCTKGQYAITPDEHGTGGVGPHLYSRNFILPERMQARGIDVCYLDSMFSYETINKYHAPKRYQKNSNQFWVYPHG